MDKLIIDCPGGERRQLYTDSENRLIYNRAENLKPVMENVSGGFDGIFDDKGNLFIAAATADGGIECLICSEAGERCFTLVSGKNGVGRISCIRLFCINGRFSLWYCLEYDSRVLLVNQFFDGSGQTEAPFAVDTLSRKKCFSVCCDNDYNTHVFYKDKDGKSRYLTYRWNIKKFEARSSELFDIEDAVSISSISDGRDIHIVFVAKRSDYYGVYYKKIGSDSEAVLDFGVGAGCRASVSAAGDKVCVCWSDGSESCECISRDCGKSFEKARKINPLKGGKNILCGYRSSKNSLCLHTNRCIYSEGTGKLLHEKEIISDTEKSFTKDNDMGKEIGDYSKKNMSELKVRIDLAARLDSIETQLMKIVCILEEVLPDFRCNSAEPEEKAVLSDFNGGNDCETV